MLPSGQYCPYAQVWQVNGAVARLLLALSSVTGADGVGGAPRACRKRPPCQGCAHTYPLLQRPTLKFPIGLQGHPVEWGRKIL
jgi:hypothetical protein